MAIEGSAAPVPGGKGFSAEEAVFAKTSGELELASEQLRNNIKSLEGELLGTVLHNSSYAGTQAGAFSQAFGALQREIQGAVLALAETGESVKSAQKNYVAGDLDSTANTNRVAASIEQSGGYGRISGAL